MYIGRDVTDQEIFDRLPGDYRSFLGQMNGCILFNGGLHIRGCANDPDWHSLRRVWIGDDRLSALYPAVHADDVPFAQDCFGNQFLLRSNSIFRLDGETGDIENLEIGWQEFFKGAIADPTKVLSLQLFERFKIDGGSLDPGQLLSVYPPLCTKETANGVSMKATPMFERIKFLADFAAQIASAPDGSKIRFVVK
jgi:hypothetical protein